MTSVNLTIPEYVRTISNIKLLTDDIINENYYEYIEMLKNYIDIMYDNKNYKGVLEKVGIYSKNEYSNVLNRIEKIESVWKDNIKSKVKISYNMVYGNQ